MISIFRGLFSTYQMVQPTENIWLTIVFRAVVLTVKTVEEKQKNTSHDFQIDI